MKKFLVFCILISMLALFPVRAENYASSEPPVEGRGIWVYATSFNICGDRPFPSPHSAKQEYNLT